MQGLLSEDPVNESEIEIRAYPAILHKIEVRGIVNLISRDALRRRFAVYGHLLSIHINETPPISTETSAIIDYGHPISAFRAIKAHLNHPQITVDFKREPNIMTITLTCKIKKRNKIGKARIRQSLIISKSVARCSVIIMNAPKSVSLGDIYRLCRSLGRVEDIWRMDTDRRIICLTCSSKRMAARVVHTYNGFLFFKRSLRVYRMYN